VQQPVCKEKQQQQWQQTQPISQWSAQLQAASGSCLLNSLQETRENQHSRANIAEKLLKSNTSQQLLCKHTTDRVFAGSTLEKEVVPMCGPIR
jgi:hypothetical protein